MVADLAIYSTLADDPVYGELVDLFVADLPLRAEALQAQFSARNWERLAQLAHQLKGAGGSYGFSPLSKVAATLEDASRQPAAEEEILAALESLCRTCRQLRSGVAQI